MMGAMGIVWEEHVFARGRLRANGNPDHLGTMSVFLGIIAFLTSEAATGTILLITGTHART